ncbi:MAG: hypothetical protein M3463_17715 [Verrucomicrobiota bacterium]|nr:hypothetical protein [Verrucomicrobiota bacterium]
MPQPSAEASFTRSGSLLRAGSACLLLGLAAWLFPAQLIADAAKRPKEKWAATWASSMHGPFVYAPPVANTLNIQPDQILAFPHENGNAAADQTFRTIIKPDLWGDTMRFRFSNVFGDRPVTFNSVTAGLQAYSGNVVDATLTRVSFCGQSSVTIPVGELIYSDPVKLKWVKGADDPVVQDRNLAVSYSVEGNSGRMTHQSARLDHLLHHRARQRRSHGRCGWLRL